MDGVRGRTLNGRYRIDEPLGSGGMATVWRGRDLHLERPVAIKLLERAGLGDPTALERFGREARAVARLAHPNVVSVYDFGTDGGDPYLIIELVEGPTLAAMLAGGPLPVDRAIAIAAQICDGLAATHAAGVVHRDIKPGNLMLTPAGVVKICDFGIARLHHAAAHATLTSPAIVMGTSEYMAPEQASNDGVDGRTDLYALGCVLYAMLTGAPPFTGETPPSVIGQHLHQPPVPVTARRPDAPADLDVLVAQLLAKNPADRPADANQVRARLAALAGVPAGGYATAAGPAVPGAAPVRGSAAVVSPTLTMAVPAEHAGSHRTPPPRGWLRPVAVSAAALAVLLIVTVIALLTWNPDRPAGQQPGAQPPGTGATTSPPDAPADPHAAVQAVRRQIEAADLRPNITRELNKKLTDVERELGKDEPEKTTEKLRELREKLDEQHEEGKISAGAYESILASVEQLDASLAQAGLATTP